MTPEQMIYSEIRRRGWSIAQASRELEVGYQMLWRCMRGKSELRLHEYLNLCALLDLDPRGYVGMDDTQRGA